MAEDLLGFLQREHDEGWLRVDPMTELSLGFLEHLGGYIDTACTGRTNPLEARIADQEQVIHHYETALAQLRTAVHRAGLDPAALVDALERHIKAHESGEEG